MIRGPGLVFLRGGGREVRKSRVHWRRHLGSRGVDPVLLAGGHHGTPLQRPVRVPAVLLRVLRGGAGLADCLPGDRIEPGAVPCADDPRHHREVRLRGYSGGVVRPGPDSDGRCAGGRSGWSARDPLHRGVREDSNVSALLMPDVPGAPRMPNPAAFNAFTARKTREAEQARFATLKTARHTPGNAVRAIGNAWSRAHYDGDFDLL